MTIVQLQEDIDALSQWCIRSNMSLNLAKCNFITFTSKKNLIS